MLGRTRESFFCEPARIFHGRMVASFQKSIYTAPCYPMPELPVGFPPPSFSLVPVAVPFMTPWISENLPVKLVPRPESTAAEASTTAVTTNMYSTVASPARDRAGRDGRCVGILIVFFIFKSVPPFRYPTRLACASVSRIRAGCSFIHRDARFSDRPCMTWPALLKYFSPFASPQQF